MSILKIKDSQGNWVGVPTVKGDTGNGISSAVLNNDYTLTLTFTDGTTYTTPSIRGEKGQTGDTPTITASKTGKTTSIYVDGSEVAQVEDGTDGTDGISPTVTITPITGGHRITITDKDGSHSADVMDGTGNVDDVQINGTSIVDENGVANVPIASANEFGAVKIGGGVYVSSNDNKLYAYTASANDIKSGTSYWGAIVPRIAHNATFYGLAKSAGDTTQSQSSNAVGTYTEDAKSAISEMLGGSVAVSGTTPTIVAKSGIRYVCGEVATLDFTPSQTGICDVVFTSGATATVLTVPSTIKWANGFDPTALDTNTTYEINIMDGLGVAVGWT